MHAAAAAARFKNMAPSGQRQRLLDTAASSSQINRSRPGPGLCKKRKLLVPLRMGGRTRWRDDKVRGAEHESALPPPQAGHRQKRRVAAFGRGPTEEEASACILALRRGRRARARGSVCAERRARGVAHLGLRHVEQRACAPLWSRSRCCGAPAPAATLGEKFG